MAFLRTGLAGRVPGTIPVRTRRQLRVAGIVADLNAYEGISHTGYLFLSGSPESVEVYRELGEFLKAHLEELARFESCPA